MMTGTMAISTSVKLAGLLPETRIPLTQFNATLTLFNTT